jgi:thiol-disulfide isomerase/thioredoxin
MKRIILYSLFIFLNACFLSHSTIETLPSFNLLLSDSTTIFNTRDIPEGKPSILLYFSPDCEYCQAETASLLQNINSFKNINFYFVSNDPLERIKAFNLYYKLYKYQNITLGRDYKYFFIGHFREVTPPYLLLYDKTKVLRTVCKGEVKAKQIIEFINDL